MLFRVPLFLVLMSALPLSAAEWVTEKFPHAPAADAAKPVWLRCYLRVPNEMVVPAEKDLWRDSMTLSFAKVGEPFAVWLNGERIIESGPVGEQRKRFKVPKGILKKGAFNALVIRLSKDTALTEPPVFAGYFDELLFEGEWQVARTEPAAEELAAIPAQPAQAFYTEAGFRRSVTPLSPTETMPGRRSEPSESLALLKAGEGLQVEDLLHEPLVAQPTHLSFDARGRLWVSQYRQYPYPAGLKQLSRDKFYRAVFDRVPPPPPNHDRGADRITVHEDTDGDGIFDQHKTVLEGLNMANAAVHGHGGIWVMHTPYLLFYPDANGDDVPDGPPEVRLAGFGLEDTHSVANGLIWGPDGWLYGGQGSTTTSRVTRPDVDSANSPGVYFEGCMVWRYHPERKIYEIFAEGGGNTFGLEFDSEGRLFSGHNGGNTRGWHFIQEGIFLKQGKDPGKFGPPTNPYALGEWLEMKSANPIPRFTHNIIVADGLAVPAGLRGLLLGADPLHRKLPVSQLLPAGATLSTKDTGIALQSEDIAFRPVYLTNAPDGSVYVADFYEEYIAHGQNYQGQIDPSTGRVYRLRAKDAPLVKDVNLASRSTGELIEALNHPQRWHRQTAVRLLGERRDTNAVPKLRALLEKAETHPALEALWALHQMGALDEPTARQLLGHASPQVRAWSIRLMGDGRELPPEFHAAVVELLKSEVDPVVRVQAGSTARRLPVDQGLSLVRALIARDADADDAFVPLLCWWTIESHIAEHREKVLALLLENADLWPRRVVSEHLAHRLALRLAAPGTRAEFLALAGLMKAAPEAQRKGLVQGFENAFQGRSLPPLPEELVAALAEAGSGSLEFQIRRADAAAIAEAFKVIADGKRPVEERSRLVRTLGETKAAGAVGPLMERVRTDASVEIRKAALGALQAFADAEVGREVAAAFAQLPAEAKPAGINLLASRPAWYEGLAKLIEGGTLKAADIPPDVTERLRADAKLAKLLPAPNAAEEGGRARIAEIKAVLAKGIGNLYEGEKLYDQRCAACHQLFHKGGNIGPNLTAYQRDDLETMLVSIVTPNAEIREGYENVTITTKDGRTLSGFLADKDAQVVVLRGFDGQDVALAQSEIAELKAAGRSLMPDGLLDGLTEQQIRDFFAYLRIPQPVR